MERCSHKEKPIAEMSICKKMHRKKKKKKKMKNKHSEK